MSSNNAACGDAAEGRPSPVVAKAAEPIHCVSCVSGRRRRRRKWLVVLLLLAVLVATPLAGPGRVRWLYSRLWLVASRAIDPMDSSTYLQPGRSINSSAYARDGDDFARRVTERLPSHLSARIAVTGLWSPPSRLPRFRAQGPADARVDRFRSRASGLLSIDDLFQVSNALRSLTRHGPLDAVNERVDTDIELYLELAQRGVPLYCRPFALLYGAVCTNKGYVSRVVGLSKDGSQANHAVCEVYMPQHSKWVLVDPDFNLAYRRSGEWLNAGELQQAWRVAKEHVRGFAEPSFDWRQALRSRRRELDQLLGIEWVALGSAGEGLRERNLRQGSPTGLNLELFEYVTYATRDDYLGQEYIYGHPARWTQYVSLPTVDSPLPAICPEGYRVTSPEEQIYWHVGRIAIAVVDEEASITNKVTVRMQPLTWMPNFDRFESRVDGGSWASVAQFPYEWELRIGQNSIEMRAVNALGVIGETVQVEVALSRSDHNSGEALPQ